MSRQVVSISWEDLCRANSESSSALEGELEAAFGSKGLGILAIVSTEESFQEKVRSIQTSLLPLAAKLHALPPAAKASISEKGTLNVNNYSEGVDGHRSGFYFHPTNDHPGDLLPAGVDPEPTFYTPNLWPETALPELKVEAREAAPFLVALGNALAESISRHISSKFHGKGSNSLLDLLGTLEDCNHKCRLLCYHEFTSEAQMQRDRGFWAAPHKDTSLLTALVPSVFLSIDEHKILGECPDPEVGLYVRDRMGSTAKVALPSSTESCILFQAGEALQIVSGGLYQATEHCVRGPPRPLAGYVRTTLAIFMQPHAHVDLSLPPGVTWEDVAHACGRDGLFKMFLLYQPKEKRSINFLSFCHREGF
eukprot:913706-Amphidinium_carterae.1